MQSPHCARLVTRLSTRYLSLESHGQNLLVPAPMVQTQHGSLQAMWVPRHSALSMEAIGAAQGIENSWGNAFHIWRNRGRHLLTNETGFHTPSTLHPYKHNSLTGTWGWGNGNWSVNRQQCMHPSLVARIAEAGMGYKNCSGLLCINQQCFIYTSLLRQHG